MQLQFSKMMVKDIGMQKPLVKSMDDSECLGLNFYRSDSQNFKIFSIHTQEYCVCWIKIFLKFLDQSFPFLDRVYFSNLNFKLENFGYFFIFGLSVYSYFHAKNSFNIFYKMKVKIGFIQFSVYHIQKIVYHIQKIVCILKCIQKDNK